MPVRKRELTALPTWEGQHLISTCKAPFALLLFILMSTSVQAGMCQVGMMTTLNLCKRCTVDFSASTKRDTQCTGVASVGYGVSSSIGSMINVDAKVHEKAQHGTVAVQGKGASWSYTPAKGFVGRDTFTLERDVLNNDQLYVMYFRFTMDVTQ